MKKVTETATSCVYRKTADIVNWFTLTNLSHQTVKHIVMQRGATTFDNEPKKVYNGAKIVYYTL